MAETLSMIGLVAGFPLLLMCFMLSLEKLESWGLREIEPAEAPQQDRVDAAVEQLEQLNAAQQMPEAGTVEIDHAVAAPRAGGGDVGSG